MENYYKIFNLKYDCMSTNWKKFKNEPIENKIKNFFINWDKNKDDIIKSKLDKFSINCILSGELDEKSFDAMADLVKKGAIWMLEELQKDKHMITRELITKYLNDIKEKY